MSAGQIVSKIPWDKILKYGPSIVEAAGNIYDSVQKRWFPHEKEDIKNTARNPSISLKELAKRISDLERNEVEQAELVQRIAEQLNDISLGMKVISDRIVIALIVSGLAILLALITLGSYLIK
ncbi:MAG: hypothetical protein ABR936_01170 [Bacteroidota bacterium]|jgi:hypothetical protein